MAAPSYTYTLTNGTTADATQVMQDFNDILNGVTDGTKDLTVSALTTNGAVNFKGNLTLGNSSANTLAFTASLNSSIPINTDATFDIGTSSKGLRTVYWGGNSFRVGITASGSTSATYTLTLPVAGGTANQVLGVTSGGSSVGEWKTFAVGTSGTDFAVAHSAGTITFNLPDAGASARGAVTTGAQAFAGVKTFNSQLIGGATSTNDSAAGGFIGENANGSVARASAVSLSTGTAKTITSVSLTAGDWEVSGHVGLITTSTFTALDISISKTNNAISAVATGANASDNGEAWLRVPINVSGGQECHFPVAPIRVSLSGTTTIYLVANATGAGTLTGYGTIHARRPR